MAPDTDMAERMVRVETKLDILIGQIDKLPPSPVCLAKHEEFSARMSKIEGWQSRVIGAFLALNIVLVLAMEKIRAFLFGS